ncbi:MAG TPA: DJ-1/PfpI/YhbO family deglycase/protease [Caldilineae bacterium]|nr:DJ-1/PfpI/YhbO family deglycase/protease [Caldilineae bacterium]
MIMPLEGLKVAVLLERGVNEIEFHYSRLRLREAGAEVLLVGNDRLDYTGEDHTRLHADVTIDQVDAADFDGVVVPGGLAPEKLRQNPQVVRFVRELYDRGKICAAICHGQQVFISAGLLRGRRVVSAWSMVDDMVFAGAEHVEDVHAVRDGTLVTARYPQDLPAFFHLVLEAFAETEGRSLPLDYGQRLWDRRFGIIAERATDATQLFYARYRIEEEGGTVLLLGREANAEVQLGSPTWEWAEHGPTTKIDRSLDDVEAAQFDGLIIPGGLGTWLIRGHRGLQKLVREMDVAHKPIAAIERGPKVLLSAGILTGRTVTCSGEMRDDLIAAGLSYCDEPIVRDEYLLFCQGTEALPEWGRAWIEMWEKIVPQCE